MPASLVTSRLAPRPGAFACFDPLPPHPGTPSNFVSAMSRPVRAPGPGLIGQGQACRPARHKAAQTFYG